MPAAHSVIAASAFSTSFSSRLRLTWSSRSSCDVRTSALSISKISNSVSVSALKEFTPMMMSLPLSIRACLSAAASSIRILGSPASIAFTMPPASSISSMRAQALPAISSVSFSTYTDPPQGSTTRLTSVSSRRKIWVFRAIRAEKSVGSAIASSSALVCNDCVCPITAAIASIQVRLTLLNGSCSVRLHPDVWQCVRRAMDLGFFGSKRLTIRAQSMRAARIFAISRK